MEGRLFSFVGGERGPWRVTSMTGVCGEPLLADVTHLDVIPGAASDLPTEARWLLRGVISNERYVTRPEKTQLVAQQPSLGRPEATCAALIPIRKSAAWWALAQDERRQVFETSSKHIETGRRYLPAIARRLHHCRDLPTGEPFDFLTWFEYAPTDAGAFDRLVEELRGSEEWRYVEREIDVRLVRP